MVHIIVGFAAHLILELLEELRTKELTKIFVNDYWVRIHRDPDFLVNISRQFKKQVLFF
ncbi:unnamed protein product, partial [Musa acuminata subsp. burmannicoides]